VLSPNAVMLARPRLLVVRVLLDVARFGSLWARGGHAVRVTSQKREPMSGIEP
jgi:hypothetical protein